MPAPIPAPPAKKTYRAKLAGWINNVWWDAGKEGVMFERQARPYLDNGMLEEVASAAAGAATAKPAAPAPAPQKRVVKDTVSNG